MATDVLVTQGARASAEMVQILFSKNILVSASGLFDLFKPGELKIQSLSYH